MKNIYFILFLLTFSNSIFCFDDMIAMLPSLRTNLQKKSFLKKNTNSTVSNQSTKILNKTDGCLDYEFFDKVDKEILDEINEINSILMKKSVDLEEKIKSEKNPTKKEDYKKKLEKLVKDDIGMIKEIKDVYNVLRKHTLRMRDEHCKKEALLKLKSANDHINSFIQTMKTVVQKAGIQNTNLSKF